MLIEEQEAMRALDAEPVEYAPWPPDSVYAQILSEEAAAQMTRNGLAWALTKSGEVEGQNTTLVKQAYIKLALGGQGLRRAQEVADRKELNIIFAEAFAAATERDRAAAAAIDPILELHQAARDLEAQMQEMRARRDALIVEAVATGTPQTKIATALGLTRAAISRIMAKR